MTIVNYDTPSRNFMFFEVLPDSNNIQPLFAFTEALFFAAFLRAASQSAFR